MLRTLRGIVLGFALLALFPASAFAADPTPTPSPPPPSPPATSPSASPSASPASRFSEPISESLGTPIRLSVAERFAHFTQCLALGISYAVGISCAVGIRRRPRQRRHRRSSKPRGRVTQSCSRTRSHSRQIIEAQALVARDELAALNAEIARVGKDLEAVGSDIAALETQAAHRRGIRERLTRDAFRLAAATATPSLASLTDAQIEAYRELLSIDASLRNAHGRLSERAAQLAEAQAAVAAKQGQLSRLRDRARTINAAAAKGEGEKRAAEVAVLEALARDSAAAHTVLAQLVANAIAADGAAPSAWSLPVRGAITQPFGPTTFALEPARLYQGVQYSHFHDAIDFAAPLGQSVVAAAEGRVTFVGHLSDGAMVVIVAHAGGVVSVYAHLDDTFARPPVRIGDSVGRGQVIGFVGLTGITTGPHLHFSVTRGGQPIDPLSLFASR